MSQNENNTQAKASKCDGDCIEIYGEHLGEVKKVIVEGWGKFDYCENAIKEDTGRGLKVTIK